MKTIFFLGALICLVSAGKLTEAENLYRSEICGREIQASDELKAEIREQIAKLKSENFEREQRLVPFWEAPFMAEIDFKRPFGTSSNDGIVISSRHVITTSRLIFSYNNYTWEGSLFDVATCKDGVMELPLNVVDKLVISACGMMRQCNAASRHRAVKGIYIGTCDKTKDPFGIFLFESETEFAAHKVIPICVPAEPTTAPGEILDFFTLEGYPGYDAVGAVQSKNATIVDCGSDNPFGSSVCVENMTCVAENGASFIKTINDQKTVVAIAQQICEDHTDIVHKKEQFSVHEHFDKICSFSGVCSPNPSAGKPSLPLTGKLTKEENKKRLEECGRPKQGANRNSASGIFRSLGASLELESVCFLISTRHAVAPSQDFFEKNNGQKSDVMRNCENNVALVPRKYSANFQIIPDKFQQYRYKVKQVTYIGKCEESELLNGLVLFEIETNLFMDEVFPFCIPEQPITAIGESVQQYNIEEISWDLMQIHLNSTKIEDCAGLTDTEKSICTTGKSPLGSALTKIINGRETAVAVMKTKDTEELAKHPSIAHYSNKICQVSGACKPKPPPTTPAPPAPTDLPKKTDEDKTQEIVEVSQESQAESGSEENGSKSAFLTLPGLVTLFVVFY